ncbi:hypothetical protein CCH79_00019142 [Gambusia affinis]|uniref:Dolichol phosphate-mannose biosynthesis regulatory protein n=1 Tax=Gambusia affinis TaxID=33528 RepID=A0A315VKN1_GAMAF|nr:hypothetical protein CCH79_00019142 [Gambusia affinis]
MEVLLLTRFTQNQRFPSAPDPQLLQDKARPVPEPTIDRETDLNGLVCGSGCVDGCVQATGADQAVGMSLVLFSLLLFTYYTVWVIVLPFVDARHVLQGYFLPREYSVILPGVAAVLLLLCIDFFPVLKVFGSHVLFGPTGTFTAVILWKNRKPKKTD